MLAKVLFKDSLELYFKDQVNFDGDIFNICTMYPNESKIFRNEEFCSFQDPKRREWFKIVIEHRYPTTDRAESVQKWKNISGAVNKNRDLARRK